MRVMIPILSVLLPLVAAAQPHADLDIWSTEIGGGNLTIGSEERGPIRVFQNICAGGQCLFTNTDPGFNSPTQDRPTDGLYALASGTTVHLNVVAIDPGFSVKFSNTTLNQAGDSIRLGTTPGIHVHPSWQLVGPSGSVLEASVVLRLSAGARYTDSVPFTLVFRNTDAVPTPIATASATPTPPVEDTPSPSATPTPTPTEPALPTATEVATASSTPSMATATPTATTPPQSPCTGDCDAGGAVTVDEIVLGIGIALGNAAIDTCTAFDANDDGLVTVDEIVQSVHFALNGCPPA